MSDSVYTNTNRSPAMTGGHDTGLYDPDRHDNRIVAVYETTERATVARDMLVKEGVPSGDIQVMDQSQMTATTPAGDATDQGIWSSIKSLFVPDEDAHSYTEGVRRGHAVLSVDPSNAADRQRVIEVLETTDPVDFDARLEEWRQAGYTNPHSQAIGAAEGMITPAPTTAGMSDAARVSAVDMPVPPVGAGVSNTAADMTATHTATTDRTGAGVGAGMGGGTGLGTTVGAVDTTRAAAVDDSDTIKVVEERLRVGKREVARGAVRVRSYVVERPVEEQVHLHDERVTLERHPVNRPVTDADMDAFRERTVEVRATGEEAIVAKEARVVEEIGIRKEASDRVETVRDTVRRTEVEVEDTTGQTGSGTSTGTAATGGQTTTSTTGATSSGMNAPRK